MQLKIQKVQKKKQDFFSILAVGSIFRNFFVFIFLQFSKIFYIAASIAYLCVYISMDLAMS